MRTVPTEDPGAARLVLVRHGEAHCNADGVVGGPKGCTGLTARGVTQVEALRDRLARTGELRQVAALYASVLPRAIETATLLAPALDAWRDGPPLMVRPECALCEMHTGDADGLPWGEFVERFGEPRWDLDPWRPLAPGAESWWGFLERAAAGLRAVADAHPGQLVVVACHAGVVEAALTELLPFARDPARRGWLRVDHAAMTVLEVTGGRGTLCRFNDATPTGEPVQQA